MGGINTDTKIMLHCNGVDTSQTFTDSSLTPKTITANGHVQIDTAESKFGGASGLFDGDGDVLTALDSADWDVVGSNADNWTIDFWVKHATHAGTECYICQFEDSTNMWRFFHVDGSGIRFRAENGGGTFLETSLGGEITDTNWHHIALCKVANAYGTYKDGTQVGYVQDNDTDTYSGLLRIGDRGGVQYFTGSIDEIRIQKANYFSASPNAGLTDTISVPTEEYSPDVQTITGDFDLSAVIKDTISDTFDLSAIVKDTISDSFSLSSVIKHIISDTFDLISFIKNTISDTFNLAFAVSKAGIDQYTLLLLHGDGVDTSQVFPDSSLYERGNGTPTGNVQVDTAQSKFGGASILFDGSGDFITYADSADWDFGSDDFTIDGWVRFSNVAAANILVARTTDADSYMYLLMVNAVGGLRFVDYSSGYNIDFSRNGSFSNNIWYHIALVRSGNNFMFFKDGVQVGATYTSSNALLDRSVGLDIGAMTQNGAYVMNGHIDELRISRGIARWTTDFTPESNPYGTEPTLGNFDLSAVIKDTISDTYDLSSIIKDTISDTFDLQSMISINVEDSFDLQAVIQEIEGFSLQATIKDTLQDSFSLSSYINEDTHYITKIISYNPLIYVTNTDPVKIVEVDISNPASPSETIYSLTGFSYAKDIVYDEDEGYFYIACADGLIAKVDASNLNNYSTLDTTDTDNLQRIDSLFEIGNVFSSTDYSLGELWSIDQRTVVKINTDLRLIELVKQIINTALNLIEGKIINTDLRLIQEKTTIINTDLRLLPQLPIVQDYPSINDNATKQTDMHVYIDGVETTNDDLDMDSIEIIHTQAEKSKATFILNRKHDNLNKRLDDTISTITNNNTISIKIKTHEEFSGKIARLSCNSDDEIVTVFCIGEIKNDNKKTIEIPTSDSSRSTHLYDAIIHSPDINKPYIDPNDENPEFFNGIKVNLGTEIKQSYSQTRWLGNVTSLAEQLMNGDYKPIGNNTYFWFGKGKNVITGQEIFNLKYIGTSFGKFGGQIWNITGASFYYQRERDQEEIDLGEYTLGSPPYKEISVKNGKFIPKEHWEDRDDGLYRVFNEGYDYTQYAQLFATVEYEKLKDINDQTGIFTSSNIELTVDGYLYYNPEMLTRINISNTTEDNIYKNNNGFPVAVKSIRITSSDMAVILSCDNQKSQTELDELDETLPDENSESFVFEEDAVRLFTKFDPNRFVTVV